MNGKISVFSWLPILALSCTNHLPPGDSPRIRGESPHIVLTSTKQLIQAGEPVIITARLRGEPWLNHEQDWLCMTREWSVLERYKTLMEGTRPDEPCGEQTITRHWDKTYTDFVTPGMSYTVQFTLYDRRGHLIDRQTISINVAGGL